MLTPMLSGGGDGAGLVDQGPSELVRLLHAPAAQGRSPHAREGTLAANATDRAPAWPLSRTGFPAAQVVAWTGVRQHRQNRKRRERCRLEPTRARQPHVETGPSDASQSAGEHQLTHADCCFMCLCVWAPRRCPVSSVTVGVVHCP